MTNEEIIKYIYKERKSNKDKKDNSRMKTFLNKIGNPEKDLKFVHVTGTNGKGSTTTMIANILSQSGYTVGKFVSPYIISFNERIQINNEFISDEDLEKYINILNPVIEEMEKDGDAPIGFEIITAIAFMYYKEKNCDIVCLEVGLGGRLDPTNVIENTLVSVITLIDYDHMELLGDTIEKIAEEKCGIIKKGKITITYPKQNKEALQVIRNYCQKNNNKLYIPNLKNLDIIKSNHNINYFSYKGTYYKLNLIGEYQIYNALLAILAANVLITLGYKISFSAITNGLFNSKMPARLEKVSDSSLVYIDGSHNVAGARTLKDFMHEYKGKKSYAIMGFTKGKHYKEFLDEVGSTFSEIVFVKYTNDYKIGEDTDKLLEYAKTLGIEATAFNSLEEAYNYVKSKDNSDIIVITGSLYLASNYRDMLTRE